MAGFVLLLNAGAGVIGNLVGGVLFDKIGGYWSIFTGSILSFISLLGLLIWHGWPTYVWFLVLLGFSSGIVFPAMFALVGTVWPEGGRKAFNAIYLAQNLGVAIGPALAGLIASYNMEAIFSINLGMYVVFFLIAAIGYRGFDKLGSGSKQRGNIILQGTLAAALIVDEIDIVVMNHDVARLKVAIKKVFAVGGEQVFYQRVKVIFQQLFVKWNIDQLEEIVFEVVEVPLHGLPVEGGTRIGHRKIDALLA